jgi:hypothetical protein
VESVETPLLVTQEPVDANELIVRRLNGIYSKYNGGLGEFFERLHRERCERNSETDRLIGVRLNAVIARNNLSDCADD